MSAADGTVQQVAAAPETSVSLSMASCCDKSWTISGFGENPRPRSQCKASALAASTGHIPMRFGTFNLAPASESTLRALTNAGELTFEEMIEGQRKFQHSAKEIKRGEGSVLLDAAVICRNPNNAAAVCVLAVHIAALADEVAGKRVSSDGKANGCLARHDNIPSWLYCNAKKVDHAADAGKNKKNNKQTYRQTSAASE
jgi:hypothetical protein